MEAVAEQRDKWSCHAEFIFSCVALSLGLGNIWRFPYLTYQNGGAAFLVPYVLLLMVFGRPMYFLELILGQFCSSSTIKSFACLPLAQCVPMVMMYAVFLTSIYYNVISCYALTHVYYSLWKVLPWTQCNSEWANKYCFVQGSTFVTCKEANESLLTLFRRINSTEKDAVAIRNGSTVFMVPRDEFESRYNGCKDVNETSMEQFFYRRFLGLTSGIDEPGGVQADIFVALLIAWIIVFVAVSRGIRSSGKVAFVTVLVPFVMLVALLIRGATLTGVGFGTAYYLLPKWRRLLEYKVWQKAAEQVLISLGVAQGMIITMGSYNEFSNNANIDVYIIAVIDTVISLVGGLVLFTVLGSMSFRLRISMIDVLRIGDIHADGLYTTGLGLVFLAYPQAISTVSQPKLWASTFFAMLFLLTLGSQMAFVESLLSALKDEFEYLQQRRTALAAVACCIGFLLGLPLTMQGGFYILNAIDTEVGGNLFRWIALFEIVYMITGYGINRLSLDAEFMMGGPIGLAIEIFWKFFCPILLLRWSEAVLPRPEWGPKDTSTLLRYQLFLFNRAVLPPGKAWADQEPLKKAALALGWQLHAEDEKDAKAAPPPPAAVGAVEEAQKEQMVAPPPDAVGIAGNGGNVGAAKEVV